MLYTSTTIIDPHAGGYGTTIDAFTDVRIDGPGASALLWHKDFEWATVLFLRFLDDTGAVHLACAKLSPILRTMFGDRSAIVWHFFRQF